MNIELIPKAKTFYQKLIKSLRSAKNQISMMYYGYESGYWTSEINPILIRKAKNGCQVNLMVDFFGSYLEYAPNFIKNRKIYSKLRQNGVNVIIFKSNKLFPFTTLHVKLAAIDNHTAFIGGSNIADHYLKWQDTNFLLTGTFGNNFHQIWIDIASKSNTFSHRLKSKHHDNTIYKINHSSTIYINSPPHNRHAEQEIINLINCSQKYFKGITWYFLPTKSIQNTLISKAKQGIKIEFIISQTNRVPITSLLNIPIIYKLKSAGIRIYSWRDGYNHNKLYWNDQHQSLLGSLNLEHFNINHCHDLLLITKNSLITKELNEKFSEYTEHILAPTENNSDI